MKWSGYFRRHDGRRVGAISRFRERVVTDTYDQFQLGRDHLRSGRPAQATVSLEKAKRAEPTSRSIREALGIAYFRLGRWQEAEAEFRVLVELDPSDEFAHYALGRALVNQGRRKEALPHVKLGRALRPRVPSRRRLARIAVRAVVQRVLTASVAVGDTVVAEIGTGLVVLLGVASGDTSADADRLAKKVARLRVFENAEGRFDHSLVDVSGEALVVSQFTLIADTSRGTRPSFTDAADPDIAEFDLRPLLCRARRERRAHVAWHLRRADGGVARQRRPGDDRDRPLTRCRPLPSRSHRVPRRSTRRGTRCSRARGTFEPPRPSLSSSPSCSSRRSQRQRGVSTDSAVPWIVASATLELAYFLLLTAAYQRSDLSLVYPIARGSAPVLVLAGATLVGVAFGVLQAIGIVLVGAGVVLVRGLRGPVDGRGVVARAGYRRDDRCVHARRQGGCRARGHGSLPRARPGSGCRHDARGGGHCEWHRAPSGRGEQIGGPGGPALLRRIRPGARSASRSLQRRPSQRSARRASCSRWDSERFSSTSASVRRGLPERHWSWWASSSSHSRDGEGPLLFFPHHISPASRNGRVAPIFVERVNERTMNPTYARERTLQDEIAPAVEARVPGVSRTCRRAAFSEPVLRVRRSSGRGRPRALRASDARPRPVSRRVHGRRLVTRSRAATAEAGALRRRDRRARLRPSGRRQEEPSSRLLVDAGDETITLEAGDAGEIRIPYEAIVRANLIDEGLTT